MRKKTGYFYFVIGKKENLCDLSCSLWLNKYFNIQSPGKNTHRAAKIAKKRLWKF